MTEAPSKFDCEHEGWALWLTPFSWWCGNCGVTNLVPEMVLRRIKPNVGDNVEFA